MAKDIGRRGFLKYAAGGITAAAAAHFLVPALGAREQAGDRPWVDRCTGKKVAGLPSACTGCGAGCGIIAYVRGGELLKIGGNPAHPVNAGSLCLVGQAGIYRLLNPERVKKPLVRAGARGEGKWNEVSWDEAMTTLAAKIKRGKNMVLETRGGSSVTASEQFARGAGMRLLSRGHIVSPNREAALKGTFGARYDWPDIANTDYVLNFGANPFESDPFGVGVAGPLAKFRALGGRTKMVTFDPRLSPTAGRSDEWFPLMPGTDAAVALAMAHVIMNEGLYDAAALGRTDVSAADLKAHLAQYTPAAAERISGIKAEDIQRVAVEYAKAGRACLLTGGGISRQPMGTNNERAVRLLPIITGKINRTGCNIIPRSDGWGAGGDAPDGFLREAADGKGKAGVYIVHECDPAYSSPEAEAVKKALMDETRFGYIVAVGTDISDTGMVADMVLPSATYLEEYGVELSPGPGGEQVVSWRQPVVMPVEECRPYVEMLSALADKLGISMGYSDSEGYADMLLNKIGKAGEGERLRDKGFLASNGQFGAAAGANGRITAAWGSERLPSFHMPEEFKNLGGDEFFMIAFTPGGVREGFTENNLLLKEIFHDGRIYINADTGRLMGLKNWDKVMVSSPSDKIEAQVILSPGIHPKAVAMPVGNGHEGYGKIEKGERFKSPDPFTTPIWWESEGEGANPARVLRCGLDASGGAGWMLSKVTVEKA